MAKARRLVIEQFCNAAKIRWMKRISVREAPRRWPS
jgi:hypothetical protein